MDNIPGVIDKVVKNDLCIGCGLCVYKCPSNALEMKWNQYGFLIPALSGICNSKSDCLDVCPFNPLPNDEVKTENELAELFLPDPSFQHPKIGKYTGIYAGYSNEFRLTSSSGGIATYILMELLEKGIVDHIFSVKESSNPGSHFEYAINSTKEDLQKASKTRYFPVTLGNIMPKIHELEGKVAIVGVACFIKAIRLSQYKEPALKEKIPFLLGIICGGVKSRFFTEYLAGKAGVELKYIHKPHYRMKDFNSNAGDYSFGCFDESENKEKTIKMWSVGDMWGTGLFKNNACDFCDDVTTELADISVGDAWLEPFLKDGHGTNVIVTRSLLSKEIISEGIIKGKIQIEELNLNRFLVSQQGSFNHRHLGLSVRLKQAKKHKIPIPPKRFGNKKVTINFKLVQLIRMKIRQKSLEIWQNSSNSLEYDNKIKKYLNILKIVTRVYHLNRFIKNKFLNGKKQN